MPHDACAKCDGPISSDQTLVRHADAGKSFHVDCWGDLLQLAHRDFRRLSAEDVASLLTPQGDEGSRPTHVTV